MPRVAINPERYQAFLNAFITLGPKFAAVARQVGCETATARRAWEKGWPEASYAPPISRIYAEHLKKRKLALSGTLVTQSVDSSAAATSQAPLQGVINPGALTPDSLKNAAVEALRQELDILQRIRATGAGLLGASERAIKGFAAMASSVAENMLVASQSVSTCTPESLLNPLERFVRCLDLMATTQERVMKMQRLLVGAPQHIMEARSGTSPADPGDDGGLAERLARLTALLQTAGVVQGPAVPETSLAYQGEESNAEQTSHSAAHNPVGGATVQDDAQGKPWPKLTEIPTQD